MPGRRILGLVPRLVGRVWNDTARELQDYLENLTLGLDEGIPAGYYESTPETIQAGDTGSAGTENNGWSAGDHEHPVSTATPTGLMSRVAAEGTSTSLARADHAHQRDTLYTFFLGRA